MESNVVPINLLGPGEDLDLEKSKSNVIISGVELSKRMQKNLLKLKGKYMSEDGKAVDYVKMSRSSEFSEYKKDAIGLDQINLKEMTEVEKKVFFLIDIYNALTIHGLQTKKHLPDSVLSVQQFFKTTAYSIGGLVYSLDDIEHGILRCNSPHPASTQPLFQEKDPRREFVLKELDPRIHFALVCGAKSCPAIRVYSVENIDQALDIATRSFCEQEVITRNEQNEVWLSKIFQWYRADFGETEVDVLRWIMKYLNKSQSDRCSILILKLEKMGPVALRYNIYDWSINKSD